MNICIFTVIKDERDYLDDFLRYHTGMGLHIFVFEDLFSVSHKDICDRYEDVEVHSVAELYDPEEWAALIDRRARHVPPQTEYINRGLKFVHSLGKYDWCWLIDIDEYITSSKPLEILLTEFEDYDAVSVYWMNFGCSGHIYKPIYDRPIYDIYDERCGYELFSDRKKNNITKFCVNMHHWNPEQVWKIHNARTNWIKVDGTKDHAKEVFDPLYLRHYITKSFEEYCIKVYRRGMFHPTHRSLQSFFEMQPQYRQKILEDDRLRDYIMDSLGIDIRSSIT